LLLLDLGLTAFEGLTKIADASPEGTPDLRKLPGSEDKQGNDEDDDELRYT
jgi:hypothetical protein